MSIRGFHIVFITIATLLCLGIAMWVFMLSDLTDGVSKYVLGGGSILAALTLVVYGVYFYNKIKKLNC